MTRQTFSTLALGLAGVVFAGPAAAQIDIQVVQTAPTAAAIADNAALADAVSYQFFVTTTGDILSVNDVEVNLSAGTLYQTAAPFGSDTDNNAGFISFDAELEADTFFTTPGTTFLLGDAFTAATLGATFPATFGDTDDDGPQNNFYFGQLTLLPDAAGQILGDFTLEVAIDDNGSVSEAAASGILIPEPTTAGIVGLMGLGLLARRRRA